MHCLKAVMADTSVRAPSDALWCKKIIRDVKDVLRFYDMYLAIMLQNLIMMI